MLIKSDIVNIPNKNKKNELEVIKHKAFVIWRLSK